MPRSRKDVIDRHIDRLLSRHPCVGFAAGVVVDRDLHHCRTHGLADLAAGTPITVDTVFRIGSITKTFTAVAIMQLVERGLVDLDAPAEDYLRAYRLVRARPTGRPATLRHLLTHTAGIPEVVRPTDLLHRLFGETAPLGAPVPSLAEFYEGALHTYAEPGAQFAYSDHNFTTVGQIVEDVSGQPLADYLDEHLFAVLGMTRTVLRRGERVRPWLAHGYNLGRHGPRPVTDYELITAAAGGAYSTLSDMARYAAALLDGGLGRHGRILAAETMAAMFGPQYRPDPRVPGIGLSFWRGEIDGHPVIDHGGILPGFNGEMFLAPEAGTAVLAFTNGAPGAMFWLPGEMSALLGHLLGGDSPGQPELGPLRPDTWPGLCGWYAVRGRLTDLRAREMTGFGVEVFVRGGRLMLRLLTPVPVMYRGFPLLPDRTDPYAFWLDLSRFGIGLARVVFSRSDTGRVSGLHFDLLPMSADRRSELGNPRRWLMGGAALAGVLAIGWVRQRGLTGLHRG